MKRLMFPALLGLALVGCSQAPQPEPAGTPTAAEAAASNASAAETSPTTPDAAGAEVAPPTSPNATEPATLAADRSIIYRGSMSLAVDNFEQASAQVDDLLLRHRAVLSTAHETRADGQHRQDLTIKVPPAQFLPLVSALGKLGRIEHKDVTSTDATADILAAEACLAAKEAADAKAKVPAAWPSAATTAARAQLRTLQQQTTWALLTLRLAQPLPSEETTTPTPDFGPRFAAAFLRSWSMVLNLALLLTNIWPVLVLGGAAYWLLRPRWRRDSPASVRPEA